VVSIATVLLLLGGLVFAIFAYVDHSNKAKERMLNEQKQEQKEKRQKENAEKERKKKQQEEKEQNELDSQANQYQVLNDYFDKAYLNFYTKFRK
ncbi:DUF4887 domain-containing protein, partial [Streptococcus agalactiae]|uniref:DUF4887 domain-containing protein n=1 Tax=Streptococcus agalactiae TaxID=1311 RepID=UPI0036403B1A